jgi:hypothetical protein
MPSMIVRIIDRLVVWGVEMDGVEPKLTPYFASFPPWLRTPVTRTRPLLYRAERDAMASTTSHPTMTKVAMAPAVILAFSFVV